MAIGKVEICGVDTSTLPVISNERMRQLFPLVHSGDMRAREEFIRGNLRLVLSVLQRFHHRGENVDDLFQVGCIGLIKALDHFDVTQNVRFSTYAVPMIIGEIRRYLRDNNAIRVSRSLRDIAYKSLSARDRLQAELGREPTVQEIARKLELSAEDVTLALEAIQDPVSLCEPIGGEGADALVSKLLEMLDRGKKQVRLEIPYSDAGIVDLLKREAAVLSMEYTDTGITAEAIVAPDVLGRVKKYIPGYVEPKEDWE